MSDEYCCECENATGRAGRADDSLYFGDHGPYCRDCWTEFIDKSVQEEITSLRARLAESEAWVDDLQAGMYINCVYCGHRYGPEDEVPATMADVLKEHIEQCPKHPMSELKNRAEAAEASNVSYARAKEFHDAANEILRADLANEILRADLALADKQRLDFLQENGTGYGDGWLVRMSTTERGLRIHETSWVGATPSIRDAIDNFIKARDAREEG